MFRLRKFLFFALIFSQLSAHAYIPPGWFLIKNMSQKKKGFKWVRIRTSIQEVQSNDQLGEKLKVTTVMDYEKDILKTTVSLDSGAVLQTKESPMSHSQVGLGGVLLFASHSETVIASLKQTGLSVPDENAPPEEKESLFLSRLNDKIVWGMGHRELPPQFLIEKDKFLPVKYLGKLTGDAAEILFGAFQFSREFPYATQIDVRTGSFRFREIFEDGLVLNSAEKEKRKTIEPSRVPSTDLQSKLIQKYFEVLR